MVGETCAKCGAKIPAGGKFCLECGTPVGSQQAPQPVQQQPMATAPAPSIAQRGSSPLEGIFDMVFSKTAIIIGVAVGILLAWIGLLIFIFAPLSWQPASLIASLGFGAMGVLLVSGGVWNKRIDKFVRLAMVLIGAWLIVQTISFIGIIAANIGNLLRGG